MNCTPIGVARTPYTERSHTPVQSALNLDAHGRVDVEPSFAEGLEGLGEFSHAWLLTWLGPVTDLSLRQVPFLLQGEGRRIGIFATRGPRRPSPIGLSLVELVAVEGLTVHFRGIDVVDGTPVIDIKPYVTRFDRPDGDVRVGWFGTVAIDDGMTPDSLRPRD